MDQWLKRCPACLFEFESTAGLHGHLRLLRTDRLHSSAHYRCCTSGEESFDLESFVKHIAFIHLDNRDVADNLYTGEELPPTCSSISSNNQIHDDKHQCVTCGKCFRKHFDLVRHERTHTGEKPYRCDICGQRFTLKCTLERHTRLRHTERSDEVNGTLECRVCMKVFLHRSSLRLHLRTQHTDVCTFPCESPRCTLVFKTRKAMLAHHKGGCSLLPQGESSKNENWKAESSREDGIAPVGGKSEGFSQIMTIGAMNAERMRERRTSLRTHPLSAFTAFEKEGPAELLAKPPDLSRNDGDGGAAIDGVNWPHLLRLSISVSAKNPPPLRVGSPPLGASTTLISMLVDTSNLARLAADGTPVHIPIPQAKLPLRLTLWADASKLMARIRAPAGSPPSQRFSFVVYPTLQHNTTPASTFNLSTPFWILISREDYAKIRHNMPSFVIDCQCEYWGSSSSTNGQENYLESYRQVQAQSCLPLL